MEQLLNRPDAYVNIKRVDVFKSDGPCRIRLCSKDKYYGGFYTWGTSLWESIEIFPDFWSAYRASN